MDRLPGIREVATGTPVALATDHRGFTIMDLQTAVVYGPVSSRRFGRTLGINLAPAGRKACNFECAYCRDAWTEGPARRDWPDPAEITGAVERALESCGDLDTISVAGNGEPTLHPAFAPIADRLFHARDRFAPNAKLTLLSNGSTLNRPEVLTALARFDERCMKLDAGDATTFRLMNGAPISLGRLIADLRAVSRVMLQSRFVHDAAGSADNTTPFAVDAWLGAVSRIRPLGVDIWTLDRTPPEGSSLQRVPVGVLEEIAARVRALAVPARVFA
jgi:wyosine [tRNA(Phe)-imidazoG37] synthetase (radical SAM superfamily)